MTHPAVKTTTKYSTDRLGLRGTFVSIFAAGIGAFVFTLASWFVLKMTHLPAFGGSNVSRALSTACTVILLVVVAALVYFWIVDETSSRVHRPWLKWLTYVVTYMSPAALVMTTLGIPLAATRLYMDGITIDQGFRTQFLTRMTDTWHLSDMNYIDMPSYYPSLWFWLGGRLANLLGLPGWQVFQPWALITLAVAGSVLVPIWQRLSGSLAVATGVALVSTCVTLVMSAEEPYAAAVAMTAPATAVLAYRCIEGSKAAMLGLGVFMGLSASTYTLHTAAISLSIGVIAAATFALSDRSPRPFIRIVGAALIAMVIAGIFWGPYLLESFRTDHEPAAAMDYLPFEGTQIPLPMFSASFIGLLCLIGLIYLVVKIRDRVVRVLAISVLMTYIWIVASMVFTLAGQTLLGFRLDIVIVMILATAGVLGIAEMRLVGFHRFYPQQISPERSQQVTLVMTVLVLLAGIGYAQSIPRHNHGAIDLAYTDTDGSGERADLYPPDSAKYYKDVDAKIQEKFPVRGETVVLTDENNFLSYLPYRGFQAFTAHYANPLGNFEARNALIEKWAEDSWESEKNFQAPDLHSPDVFIFHGEKDGQGWKYDIAENIYPNSPNIRHRGIWFNPKAFADSAQWDVSQIGPFVVVTRAS